MTPTRVLRNLQPLQVADNPSALLRFSTVQALTGLSRSTIYARVKAGTFPAPLRQGSRCSRWRAGGITEWLAAVGQEVKQP